MSEEEKKSLKEIALRVRESVIRMTVNGGCFIGASLSCADLLVYLYNRYLNITPDNLQDVDRDYLLLSKGHDVPALYALFAEIGLIPKGMLNDHLSTKSNIYWHPNRDIPGIEFHSGSLGHLPAVAAGVALDCKLNRQRNKIVVLTGDGELNEGSVWETALVASAFTINNLLWIVDRNHFQANIATEELIALEPLDKKFEAFGWDVYQVDGHDFDEMDRIFNEIELHGGKPTVLIADTVRGKGLPSLERRADRWFCQFTPEEADALIQELHDNTLAMLHSETVVVR